MRFRNAKPEDFDDCIALLEKDGGFCAAPAVHESLHQLWCDHLSDEVFASFQVFETHTGDDWEIVAFRNCVFVTHEFRREYAAAPFPQVAAEIWRRVLNGESPILNNDEIAIANGNSDLNMVITHFATRHRDPAHPEVKAVLAMIIRARQHAHTGYRIAHLTAYEVFGAETAAVIKSLGYQQYTLVDPNGESLQHNPSESSVLCWSHEEDTVGSSTLLSLVTFACPEPRFAFSKSKQRLMRQALDGLSDKEIAETLGIRHDTIRHRWESIYKTVQEIDPTILPVSNTRNGRRGAARRHLLLEYLRQHMEEVRPFKPPSRLTAEMKTVVDKNHHDERTAEP